MASSRSSLLLRRLRTAAIVLAALLAVFAALFVSFSPTVEQSVRPTARDIAAAREAWHQLREARGSGSAVRVRIDNRMIRGLSALASDATGLARFDGQVRQGVLSGRASVALPAGLWVNASGTVTGQHDGFPAFRLKVGRVAFPMAAGRWAADFGRLVLRLRGATLPPLDEVVRQFRVDQTDVVAQVALPEASGMVTELVSARSAPLNEPLVSDIYCAMAADQRDEPVSELSQMTRRLFDPARGRPSDERTRATFVALSFLVVRSKAEILAPRAAAMSKDCTRPFRTLLLQGRDDLAKHWALSAALAAVLGEETTDSLGEWKELNDSLEDGSGFSFVDIAADRAGARTALRALDPATADRTLRELARATEDGLLPSALLNGPEGLSEASFVDRYGSLDRERYRRAIGAIDRELAR